MNSKNLEAMKLRSEIDHLHKLIRFKHDMTNELKYDPKERSNHDVTKVFNMCDPRGELIQKLSAKVDQWCALQEPGTQDHTMGLIMKASALRFRSSYETNKETRIELLKKALVIVEPFAETEIGFYPYMNMWCYLTDLDVSDDGIMSPSFFGRLKKVYDVVMEFKRKPEVLVGDYFCIFSGTPPTLELSEELKEMFKNYLAYNFHLYYTLIDTTDRDEKLPEFMVPAIRYLFNSINSLSQYTQLLDAADVVQDLVHVNQFKQLDHCLAGLMFHTARYRKSLPKDKRYTVSKIQAKLANTFIVWGSLIAFDSMQEIDGKKCAVIYNQMYEEIEEFTEPGVEIYAHQFPVELVKTPEAVEKIIKRCKAWYKRLVDLSKEAKEDKPDKAATYVSTLVNYYNVLFPDHQMKAE